MTEPVVTLDPERTSVEPGGQAQVTVTISNPGTVVEGYRIDVLGDGPSQWAEVLPPEVSVYPQQQATVIIVFSPPSGSSAPGGQHAFGVRVRSNLDPANSAVAEGDIEIGKTFGLQAKIIPVTSSGRWRGRHVVQLSNWGNSGARLRIVASDPDAALGFLIRPDVVDLPLGGSATVRMSVRTRKPFLRGTPVRLPFQVVGERLESTGGWGGVPPGVSTATPVGPTPMQGMGYGDPARPVVDGALTQKPILSRFVVTAAALVLIAGIALGAWALLRKEPAAARPPLTDQGVPPTPEGVQAAGTDPTTIEVTWEPVEGAEGYEIRPVEKGKDGSIGTPTQVDPSQRKAAVKDLAPDTEHCFRVVAKRKNVSSVPSEEVCARTLPGTQTASPSPSEPGSPSPSGSPSPGTGTGNGTPSPTSTESGSSTPTPSGTESPGTSSTSELGGGKWVAVNGFSLGTSTKADNAAEALEAEGLDAQVIDKTEFPNLIVNGEPAKEGFFYTAIGPFDSPEAALAVCEQARKITGETACVAGQPEPQ